MSQVTIRDLRPADCQTISAAFASQGWTKPTEQFHTYFLLQKEGTRDFLLAEWEREFAGYLTIIGFGLTSDYGAAQVLHIKRGYIPDGRGLVKDSISLALGQTVEINHDLALYLTKLL